MSTKKIFEAWTDGSVQPKNPGTVSSGAAVVILLEPLRFSVRSTYRAGGRQTNNAGEILGIINAIRQFSPTTEAIVTINSDSLHALNGMIRLIQRGEIFKTNRDLWSVLYRELDRRKKLIIVPNHVDGHSGLELNDYAHYFSHASALFQENYSFNTSNKVELYEEVEGLKRKIRATKRAQKKTKGTSALSGPLSVSDMPEVDGD